MSVSQRLDDLGLTLPEVPEPLAAYVPAVRHGDLIMTSGQLPLVGGAVELTGLVGAEVTPEQAHDLARTAALNAIAAAASVAGGVDEIDRVLKVVGYIASAEGFTGQPQVLNGASHLIGELFGAAGAHARAAVGVAQLPAGAPVEVEITVSVRR